MINNINQTGFILFKVNKNQKKDYVLKIGYDDEIL